MALKNFIAGLVVLAGLLGLQTAWADEWSTTDTALELSWQVLHVVDWGQTRYIAQHPDVYHEKKSGAAYYIGEHPTVARVNRWAIVTGVGHWVIADYLKSGWQRTGWQAVTLAITVDMVQNNYKIGIGMAF